MKDWMIGFVFGIAVGVLLIPLLIWPAARPPVEQISRVFNLVATNGVPLQIETNRWAILWMYYADSMPTDHPRETVLARQPETPRRLTNVQEALEHSGAYRRHALWQTNYIRFTNPVPLGDFLDVITSDRTVYHP